MNEYILLISGLLILNTVGLVWTILRVMKRQNTLDQMVIGELRHFRARIGAFQFVLRHFMDPEYWPGYDEAPVDMDAMFKEYYRFMSDPNNRAKLEEALLTEGEERFYKFMDDLDVSHEVKSMVWNLRIVRLEEEKERQRKTL